MSQHSSALATVIGTEWYQKKGARKITVTSLDPVTGRVEYVNGENGGSRCVLLTSLFTNYRRLAPAPRAVTPPEPVIPMTPRRREVNTYTSNEPHGNRRVIAEVPLRKGVARYELSELPGCPPRLVRIFTNAETGRESAAHVTLPEFAFLEQSMRVVREAAQQRGW